jgi:drug/metabolite transporter (DMT)-like permease
LAPIVVERGLQLDRLGWSGLGIIIAGAGVPYVLLAAEGLRFAPAHDQGALNPGFMPLFVALIAAVVFKERLATARKLGLGLILVGALIIVGCEAAVWDTSRLWGEVLFLTAGLLWASFTVVVEQARLDAWQAAALVSTGSATIYLPIYLACAGTRLAEVPLADLALQAIFQGFLVTIVSLVLFARAVALIGASGGAAFGALVPGLSALFAIVLIGEWPRQTDWLGIALISAGVYLASGGPLRLGPDVDQSASAADRGRSEGARLRPPPVVPREGSETGS